MEQYFANEQAAKEDVRPELSYQVRTEVARQKTAEKRTET